MQLSHFKKWKELLARETEFQITVFAPNKLLERWYFCFESVKNSDAKADIVNETTWLCTWFWIFTRKSYARVDAFVTPFASYVYALNSIPIRKKSAKLKLNLRISSDMASDKEGKHYW